MMKIQALVQAIFVEPLADYREGVLWQFATICIDIIMYRTLLCNWH